MQTSCVPKGKKKEHNFMKSQLFFIAGMSKHRHKTVTHPQAACPETNVAHSEQPNIPIIPSIPKL